MMPACRRARIPADQPI